MKRHKPLSPVEILATIIASIFFSEFLVMLLIALMAPLAVWAEAIVDSLILVAVLSPLLYLFLFRPLVAQQRLLREAGEELEQRVAGRTMELTLAKEALETEIAEHKLSDRALFRVNRALKALSSTNKALIHMADERSLLDEICSVVVKAAGYRLAWVGFALDDVQKSVVPMAQAGYEAGYLKALDATWADTPRGQGPVGRALRSGAASIAKNILTDPGFGPWKEEAAQRGYASCLAVPFALVGHAKGVIVVYAEEPDAFDHDEVTLFTQLAENLAFGIDALRIKEEHKRAEDELRDSETRFRSVTESANDAIISADGLDRITSWNRGASNIFGYAQDEVLGRPLTMLMPEKYREAHTKGMERVAATGVSVVMGSTLEFEGLRKDGSVFPLELSIASWRTNKGVFYSGIIRDITERKRAEEEKQGIQAQLLHAQKLEALGRLVMGVSHEFTNIILSIKGFCSSAVKRLAEEDPSRKNMEQILSLAERGMGITRQLQLFGRKSPANLATLDINETARELLKMTRHLLRPNVKMEFSFDPGLLPVRADKGNIEQVLMNLIVNAVDAMPNGGVLSIKTKNVDISQKEALSMPEARAGGFVRIMVSDTGLGMERAVMERIFDPFFSTKGDAGTGLGLSVIYGIVNRHDGWITVKSRPGQGSAFEVYLPAQTHG